MNLLERRSAFFVVCLCVPLLFFPKINLISVGETETAGLRIDDLCLLFCAVILFWAHSLVRKGFLDMELILIGLVGFSCLSFLSNRVLVTFELLHLDAKIFYCFRILEYFVFFYIGTLMTRFLKLETLIKAFFAWNLLLMLLQKIGAIGEFNSTIGYNPEGTARVSGIASFPSEMGALLNLMFCFFLFSPKEKSKIPLIRDTYEYWLFLLFGILIAMTGSRIAMAALILPFLFKLKQELSFRSVNSLLKTSLFILFASLLIAFVVFKTESIIDRSKGLISWKNVELAAEIWDKVNIDIKMDDHPENAVSYEGHDLSWWIRIHKWVYYLKTYATHPECYLQGIGPGCAGAALDGGLLRILIENGVIGVFLFFHLFRAISRKSEQLQWLCFTLLLNMIFFDAYLAYKPMSLLFLVAGCSLHQEVSMPKVESLRRA